MCSQDYFFPQEAVLIFTAEDAVMFHMMNGVRGIIFDHPTFVWKHMNQNEQ